MNTYINTATNNVVTLQTRCGDKHLLTMVNEDNDVPTGGLWFSCSDNMRKRLAVLNCSEGAGIS
jgi:hypothetical protein